jgi:hypothetical protein
MTDAGRSSFALDTEDSGFNPLDSDLRSDDDLENEIAELATHIDAATYRLLRAIAEFDRREAWGWGFQSTAHWLTWRVGIDMVTAREKVRVARALGGLPQIFDTFRLGKVSYSKVRTMTRIATPENEGYLLYIAENGTASDVESLVRAYRRTSRGEDLEEARRHREERYLDMYTDEDGMVVIRGRLPQEVAAVVEKALQAAVDLLREEEQRGQTDGDDSAESLGEATPTRNQGIPACAGMTDRVHDSAESSGDPASMDAGGLQRRSRSSQHPPLEEACGSVRDDSAESLPRGDFAQRRVDALGLLAEAALGNGLGKMERGEPYQVMVHVDSAILVGRLDDGICELENVEGIVAESCRRLACDAPHVAVTHDTEGNVLHMGRKARRISKPLWRALISRDRTCRFPGCDRTRHLQAHHIEHWARGGETNPENLALLCRSHHWAVHEGGVRVEGRAPQGLTFHRPDGRVLPFCPVPVPIKGKAGETLKEVNRRHGLEITANTVDLLWDGERMDLHMAVDGVIAYDDDPGDNE